MTNDKKLSDSKQSCTLDELRQYGAKEAKKIFGNQKQSDFDERDLASGSKDLLDKSDAELFPTETEEYTEKERKPKVVVDNNSKGKQ